jgi:hypothetical protein
MSTMTDWEQCRRRSYQGRYLFCSAKRTEGTWLRDFTREAPKHGARVVVEDGHVYIIFEDQP